MPQVCNKMVTLGGVTILCEKLANVESFEVVENILRALGKIVHENAYSILAANGFLYLLQLIDFFDHVKQKSILSLLTTMVKYINAPENIETYLAPAMPLFKGIIVYRNSEEKSKEILELAISLYSAITDSIARMHELAPFNIGKLRKNYEFVAPKELMDNFFEILIAGSSSAGYLALTDKTWQNIMIALRYLCKFSPRVCKQFISNGIFQFIQGMLSSSPQPDADETTHIRIQEINESVVLLLDAILPQKQLSKALGKEAEGDVERVLIDSEKEKILMDQGEAITSLCKAVLPRIIAIYDESAALTTKFFCLQIIDKFYDMCLPEVIVKVLQPQAIAYFIYENLTSVESIFVCFGLKLCEVILQKLSKIYIRELKREGVFEIVNKLQDIEALSEKISQQSEKVWFTTENAYVKYFLSFAPKDQSKKEREKEKSEVPFQFPGYRSAPLKLKYYISTKSKQLLKNYFENPKIVNTEEIITATNIYNECQKLASQLDVLLKMGIMTTAGQWREVYQLLAEVLVSDINITNYELKCTGLISKLFYSLCVMPTEYVRMMLASNIEEVKEESEDARINAYISSQRNELTQLVIRHKVFISTMTKPCPGRSNALSELIRRLNEILMHIERSVNDNKESASGRYSMQKFSITLMYSPKGIKVTSGYTQQRKIVGEVPEEIKDVPELVKMHEIYSRIPLYSLMLPSWGTLKSAESFLKHKSSYSSRLLSFSASSAARTQTLDREELMEDEMYAEEQGMIPEILQFHTEIPEASISNVKPLTMKRESKHSKISFRFFYNGYELINKRESLGTIMNNYSTPAPDFPADAQGVLFFQLQEKKPSKKSEPKKKVEVKKSQSLLISNLTAVEQYLLNMCVCEIAFTESQIKDQDTMSCIKLLKAIHSCLGSIWRKDEIVLREISHIKESDFLNAKIEKLAKKQMQDSYQSLYLVASSWLKTIATQCPFTLTEQTRNLLFRMCFFDIRRSLHYLVKYLKISGNPSITGSSKLNRAKTKIHRKKIIESGIQIMNGHTSINDLLEFDFFDENGSGLGPTLEFYSLSASALREMKPLWRSMEKGTLFPAPLDPNKPEAGINRIGLNDVLEYFRLAGWLSARAILDERLVDLPFAELFWDLVIGKRPTFIDIKRLDEKIGRFLLELDRLRGQKTEILKVDALTKEQKKQQIEMLKLNDSLRIADMGLTFVLQGYDHIELKKGGKDIIVTIDNIEEYLDLTAVYTLHRTIHQQIQAFKEGFESLITIDALRCFKIEELEDLVCGGKEDKWVTTMLSDYIIPTQGFDKASPQYSQVLVYLSKLDLKMQRLFLQYATGSPRLPHGGFKTLNPKLTVAKRIIPEGASPDDYLPSVMTCQNFLKVPEYSSYDVLKAKFDYALKEGQNSFTLS